ncbi:MAG: mycofactocin precursor MftA [Aeromicrobium sp.]
MSTLAPAEQTTNATGADEASVEDVLVDDVLVEEVSIDGMCGVY